MRRILRNALRRAAVPPRVYSLMRSAMLVGQKILRRPDEPDLRGFAVLAGSASLIADIGANGGQSAVALSFIVPDARIVSFEPNPVLWRELAFVQRLLGSRFERRQIGLGPEAARMQLHIPTVGGLPITTRASLTPDGAREQAARLESDTGRRVEITSVEVSVETFDSLDLMPSGIKIDVEGYEYEVLSGMVRTLCDARPLVMLECNARDGECLALLEPLGYRRAWFDRPRGCLTATRPHGAGNWYAVPDEMAGRVLSD
ncbi:FkbM family methyltransferase [Tsuneonella suprasediminis]|uniref:FkbM family methyltransferase n=1 Tax=Tsuneonella suprasediminis TaxID=2306996 RepID=A0A419QY86_9SPHN|nr:FkbM family methyltransferase [Tsuneonella suprasediminis]RJX65528.1 FkbM family methyltransferase [Tsuneonella suprasediminis]